MLRKMGKTDKKENYFLGKLSEPVKKKMMSCKVC